MKQYYYFSQLFILLILGTVIGGCHSVVEIKGTPTNSIILNNTISYTASVSPTVTINPSYQKLNPRPMTSGTQNIPNVILTGTKKPNFTSTIMPSQTQSLTPFPTIQPDEIQVFLRNLMINNGGCRLPCWWGITPAITSWEGARQFLESFESKIFHNESLPDSYSVEYGISKEGDYFGAAWYYVRNGTVISIVVSPLGTDTGYQLNQMLDNYGVPDEISIFTYPYYLSHGQLPFIVILRYLDEKVIAYYEFRGDIIGDNVLACLGKAIVGPSLIIGESQDPVGLFNIEDQSLETATGKSVTDFFQTYRTADNTFCLRTPVNMWK
jgi:hypothetical protein